ncbi:YkvA family protein [Brassicibacter mesophilus]|uniref:YkvA family protein n=1 Tax=Brassicibacter mesophilus TaxID=745119 RepID=UPI003D1BC58C
MDINNVNKDKRSFKEKIIKLFKRDFKNWESKSRGYIEDKESARRLLLNARKKANSKPSRLKDIWENVQLLFSFIKDWLDGAYKEVSTQTIVIMIVGILYFVVPTDIIPDFIIALGLADDAVVLGFIIKQVEDELQKYKEWKNNFIHEIDSDE